MERFARAVSYAGGVVFCIFGIWAFVAPSSFFASLATFEPYNPHFVRDIGAFQLGLGAVLLLPVVVRSALTAALGGGAVGSGFHATAHVIDRHLGGSPATDIPLFFGTTVLLAAAAIASHRASRGAPGAR